MDASMLINQNRISFFNFFIIIIILFTQRVLGHQKNKTKQKKIIKKYSWKHSKGKLSEKDDLRFNCHTMRGKTLTLWKFSQDRFARPDSTKQLDTSIQDGFYTHNRKCERDTDTTTTKTAQVKSKACNVYYRNKDNNAQQNKKETWSIFVQNLKLYLCRFRINQLCHTMLLY